MTADDVIKTCQAAPNAQIIAVHMEAINHCLLTRADLAFQLEAARVIQQVAIPQDGDWVDRQQLALSTWHIALGVLARTFPEPVRANC